MADTRTWAIAWMMVALGCGCGEASRPTGPSAAFGEACTSNASCTSGFCLENVCTAACTPAVACPAGYRCVAATASLSVCAPGSDAGIVCAARETACSGGRDDDCDGTIDCADIDCSGDPLCGPSCVSSPENGDRACTNGIDDDCDALVDCLDMHCRSAPACLGDYVDDACETINGREDSQSDEVSGAVAWAVTDLRVELTATGFRTLMSIPGGAGGTLTLTSTARTPRDANLQAPPNEYLRTCTDCVVLFARGRTYFQRRGRMTYTSVPTAVGERLEGRVWAHFDEVRLVAGEYELMPGAVCIEESATFSGVAVSGGVTGSGAGSFVGSTSGMGMTSGTGSCGDNTCDASETPASCPADCPCDSSEFTMQCPAGHFCPRRSECTSRGRCTCAYTPGYVRGGTILDALSCGTGATCTDASCRDDSWGCMRLEWDCGWTSWTPCGRGGCPAGSVCAGPAGAEVCECRIPGGQWMDCSGTLCTDVPGGCEYPSQICAVPEPP